MPFVDLDSLHGLLRAQLVAGLLIPGLVVALGIWAGRSRIRAAQKSRAWTLKDWAMFVPASLVALALVIPLSLPRMLFLLTLSLYLAGRGLNLLGWCWQASRPVESRRQEFAGASPARLGVAGVLTLALALFLATFSFPPELIRASHEGATKGNLGLLREAVGSYRREHGGSGPADFSKLVEGGYLRAVPPARPFFHHPASAKVLRARQPDDTGGWLYNDALGDSDYAGVWVNCTHTDSKAMSWTGF